MRCRTFSNGVRCSSFTIAKNNHKTNNGTMNNSRKDSKETDKSDKHERMTLQGEATDGVQQHDVTVIQCVLSRLKSSSSSLRLPLDCPTMACSCAAYGVMKSYWKVSMHFNATSCKINGACAMKDGIAMTEQFDASR